MIMRLAFLLGLLLWLWLILKIDYEEKKLDEKYGGNSDEGFESNLNKPVVSEAPMWRK